MDIEKHIQYWKTSAQRDWKTSQGLFELKRYDACLFFFHLSLEKLLKGLVVTQTNAPYIHDLERLAVIGKINLSLQQFDNLRNISAFNIAGRYSDYKFSFYKKCTPSYTKKYILITKELIKCLKKEYPKT